MKLSDYVMQFLADSGVKQIFMLAGGGSMHLVDSLGRQRELEYIPFFHEQAVAIACEAYGQFANDVGVGLVTTGPGGTNAITGVTAAWIDSTPMLILSGQVKRADRMNGRSLRQMGPQEVEIVPMVTPITKYAVTVTEPNEIRYHLEKAWYLAQTGRKGPVWLDIPLDVQGAIIDETALRGFVPNELAKPALDFSPVLRLLGQAKCPLILAGNGVKLANAGTQLLAIAEQLHIPILTTWKMADLLGYDHPLNFGSPGVMGMRYSNFILQNCDLLLILGSRLDNSITAYNQRNFGKRAKHVIVDVDANEIDKLDIDFAFRAVADVGDFLGYLQENSQEIQMSDRQHWLTYCRQIKQKYPVVLEGYRQATDCVDSYIFIEELCKQLTNEDIIVPESSGGAGEITFQAFQLKAGQQMKNAAGLGSMGFGLPYAIGACFAYPGRRTILINGDGAFQLNIQELETVVRNKLPVKIFIWNNGGYASIMNTQKNLFEGNYVGSGADSKLTMPDISKIAEAYGIRTCKIHSHAELAEGIQKTLQGEEACLCEVFTSPAQAVLPKVQSMKLPNGSMASKPIEDMFPFLSDKEVEGNQWKPN